MAYNYDEFNGQSLVFKYNVDNNGNPITVKIENENKQVSTHGTIQLEHVPDEFNRVLMLDDKNKEMVEVFNKDEITPTTYYIDYNNGVAYLDKTQFGKTKIYNYYSRGLQLIGCSRIFDEHDVRGQNVLLTLQEIIDAGKECIRILLNIGDAWQIIQRLERDIAEGRQLILDIEGKIIEARADVDGMLVELEDKKTDCIKQIDEAVQNGMDNIVNVAGNIEIKILSSAWVLNNGSYEKQITHNLNSEKLHISAINSDTKEAITIGYKVVDKSNVILKSDENINANIILSASYYNPYLYGNGEIAEEVVAARKGETSLDVKIGKIDTAIAEHSASLDNKTNELENKKAEKVDLNTTNKRIDNIIKNEGTSINDLELQDIRVGINNEIYSSAGEAVRTQSLLFTKYIDGNIINNIFDYESCIKGEYVDFTTNSGQIIKSEPYYRNKYIYFKAGLYTFLTANLTCTYVMFDNKDSVVKFGLYTNHNQELSIPDAVCKLAINTHVDDTPEDLIVLLNQYTNDTMAKNKENFKLKYIPKIPLEKIDATLPIFKLNIDKNLFDEDLVTYGVYCHNGVTSSNSEYFTTNKIDINGINSLCVSDCFYNFYNNSSFISGDASTSKIILNPPLGTTHIVISRQIAEIANTVIYEGTEFKEPMYTTNYPIKGIIENNEMSIKINKIIVKSNGNKGVDCDYTHIKDALDNITDNSYYNRYIIDVKAGLYNVADLNVKYLGFKNYVEVVGENKSGVKVINRYSENTYDATRAGFDPEYYADKIEYSAIKNMTIITKGCKCPVHIDTSYEYLADGGVIEIDNCLLIDENPFDMNGLPTGEGEYYCAGGVNTGLRVGQTVRVKNCDSNGFIYSHNVSYSNKQDRGCTFEMYNCRCQKSMFGALGSKSPDKAIIKGCKIHTLFIDEFNAGVYDWSIELEGNDIDFIKGKSHNDPTDPFRIFDDLFDGKFVICDSRLHILCYNNTNDIITRTNFVELENIDSFNPCGTHIKTHSNGLFYGMAMENISPKSYGIIQYNGVLEVTSNDNIIIGDELECENNMIKKRVNGRIVGVALENNDGNGTKKIEMKIVN